MPVSVFGGYSSISSIYILKYYSLLYCNLCTYVFDIKHHISYNTYSVQYAEFKNERKRAFDQSVDIEEMFQSVMM